MVSFSLKVFVFWNIISQISGVIELFEGIPHRVGCFKIVDPENQTQFVELRRDNWIWNRKCPTFIQQDVQRNQKPITSLTYIYEARNSSHSICNLIKIPETQVYHEYIQSKFIRKESSSCDTDSFQNEYLVYCPQVSYNRFICDALFSLPIQNVKLLPIANSEIEIVSPCIVEPRCTHLTTEVYLKNISPSLCLSYCQAQLIEAKRDFFAMISGYKPNNEFLNSVYTNVAHYGIEGREIFINDVIGGPLKTHEWGNCACVDCKYKLDSNIELDQSCSSCIGDDNFKCGYFNPEIIINGTYSPPRYSVYKLGTKKGCNTFWSGNRWVALESGITYQTCSKGNASWECLPSGNFKGVPNVSNCSSSWITNLELLIQNKNTIEFSESENYLSNFAKNLNKSQYYGHEIQRLFMLGANISEKLNSSISLTEFENIIEQTLDLYQVVLKNEEPWKEIKEQESRAQAGTTFLKTWETILLELGTKVSTSLSDNGSTTFEPHDFGTPASSFQTTIYHLKNVENAAIYYPTNYADSDSYVKFEIWQTNISDIIDSLQYIGLKFDTEVSNLIFSTFHPVLSPSRVRRSPRSKLHRKPRKVIQLPKILITFPDGSTSRMSNIRKRRDAGFPRPKSSRGIHRPSKEKSRLPPVCLTYGSDTICGHFEIKFSKKNNQVHRKPRRTKRDTFVDKKDEEMNYDYSTAQCVYWDTENSYWSPNGCYLIENSLTEIICQCETPGLFSVVFDMKEDENPRELNSSNVFKWINLVVFGISSIAIAITIMVFVVSPISHLQTSPDSRITLNILVALLLQNVLCVIFLNPGLLLTISEGKVTILKIIFEISANYIFLWILVWNIIESWKIYRSTKLCYISKACIENLIGYGLPTLIILVKWIILKMMEEDFKFEWVENYYDWTFIAPIAFFILVTILLLILSLRKTKRTLVSLSVERRKRIRTHVLGALRFTLIICLATVSGFIAYSNFWDFKYTYIFEYLFVIFIASEGIYLFFFHVGRRGIICPGDKLLGSVSYTQAQVEDDY